MENEVGECNVLGSGPSRKSYIPNNLITIGCNIPFCRVDYNVVFDENVLLKILENPKCINEDAKYIISNITHEVIKRDEKLKKFFEPKIDSLYKMMNGERKSSAHYACLAMISKGFNKLNIYGCDNYFGDRNCLDNWTHNIENPHYIPENLNNRLSKDTLFNKCESWNRSWHIMINQHPKVEFNFIP